MSSFDAIVIGAGSVGLPSAFYLGELGLKVLVLEELPAPGQGQHKAAIGGVRATHSDPAKILLCQDSLEVFRTFEERHGISVGWKPGGYVFPVYADSSERTLKGLLERQHSYGLNIEWVDAQTMAELVPGIQRQDLRGGTYSPEDGQVSPLLAADAFRRLAEGRGAKFRFRDLVTAIDTHQGRVRSVTTASGETFHAPLVLNASGSHARQVGALVGLDVPVRPDSHEAGITAPLAHFLRPLVVDIRPGREGRTANFYFGQNHEGQIIFCYTPRELFYGEDREATSEFLPVVTRRLIELVPRLRNMLIRRTWRGLYPMTPDGVAIVDRTPIEGYFLAVGMCGQGFMLGPGVGRNIATLMVEGRQTLREDAARMLRFDRDFGAAKSEALK
ncbi:MAG: FAD-dependent oxidoreductase [Polyangia bacterium]|jgi:sarcosine oxidase subunit beta|nr:FAD-dependent oxidoreductase [Polyangia bacterium]